ncbi:helix-turn-helix domain-containing protein [Chryseobacterium taihuense]|uniref:AraC-type DNA-binding protein n=1 Tax=Chryseobacterium taihuense TaxID=1141221 RepID=A0ABY0QRY8_9FLAO|nr:helix-turn-helix domain-containing protein [Chryseobacterium taihuense]SDL67768.1 AraC-type DNA-binding protein [Chryseobacterium taihuense]
MYKITEELRKNGFSINLVSKIIERNNFSKIFNTLEYFCIFLVADNLEIFVENKKYNIPGGNAAFVGPYKQIELGNVYHKSIYVIAFSRDFFDKTSKDSFYLNSHLFFNFKSEIFISPYYGTNDYNNILLVERLQKFSRLNNEQIYLSAAHNAIESLILDAYLNENYIESISPENLEPSNLVNKFTVLLQRDYKIHKKVSHYADQLKVSSRKLTETTELIYGKSAKQMIIEKVSFECEKAIRFSTRSLSEIAFDLGFNDEGNFTNFIKKHLGRKPSEMREMAG